MFFWRGRHCFCLEWLRRHKQSGRWTTRYTTSRCHLAPRQASSPTPKPRMALAARAQMRGVGPNCILPPPYKNAKARWYVIPSAYGRERKGCYPLAAYGVRACYLLPTQTRVTGNKRQRISVSCLADPFFAYCHGRELTPQAQHSPEMTYPSFCPRHLHGGDAARREPGAAPPVRTCTLMVIGTAEEQGNGALLPRPYTSSSRAGEAELWEAGLQTAKLQIK